MRSKALLVIAVLAVAILVYVYVQASKTSEQVTSQQTYTYSYLPLGDSYTIGESVDYSRNFPNQLAGRLQAANLSVGIPANKSVTGYTSADLIKHELPLVSQTKPDVVTILIGVNDYVQGVPVQTFEKNLRFIVAETKNQLANPANIVLLTIPDYAKTPTGARFGDPATASQAIQNFNGVISRVAAENQLPVVDIFPISQGVSDNPALVADDGLHPSAQQYSLWVDALYPIVKPLLSR